MSSDKCSGSCSSCGKAGTCSSKQTPKSFLVEQNKNSNIKKVIAIMSGKGGVGKSMVTSLLAVLARRKNLSVAILDGDITGPSIPKMFGITDKARGNENGILPSISDTGMKLMSMNLLLPNETDPVIWRGPVIDGTIKQFWNGVQWGDVDIMFIDMPPGTGDVPLTVFQALPIDGVILVTSPQELVSMIVQKASNMAKIAKKKILGIVENMSYIKCPCCSEKIEIFPASNIENMANKLDIDSFAKMPLDKELCSAADSGRIEYADFDYLNEFIDSIIAKIQ